MFLVSILAGLASLLCVILLRRRFNGHRDGDRPKRRRLIEAPSPGSFPLLGSLLHVRHPLYKFLAEEYPKQDVVLMYFGSQRVYCLNSTRAIKEAYLNQADVFAGRPKLLGDSLVGETGGLVFIDGPVWRDYRRFTLRTLRDFGFGKSFTEASIVEEIQLMREDIEASPDKKFDSSKLVGTAVSNVICRFLFGRRLASEDPKFELLQNTFARLTQEKDNISELFSLFIMLTLCGGRQALALRLLQYVPEAKRVFDNFLYMLAYCRNISAEHRANFVSNSQPKDYIEAHMQHCHRMEPQSPSTEDSEEDAAKPTKKLDKEKQPWLFNDTRMCLAMADLFIAGSDTTTTTIRWALLLFHQNPDCYRLAAEEILREIGVNRPPAMKDRLACHYLQACIDEVHRCASMVPLGLLHRCLEDTQLLGYDIPKDSLTFVNQYTVNNNPDVFPEPDKFRPERFLDSEGRYSPSEHVMPFSVGKRACLGESLARMELFLLIAAFLQRYERIEVESLEDGVDLTAGSQLKTTPGDIRAPPAFSLRFHPR